MASEYIIQVIIMRAIISKMIKYLLKLLLFVLFTVGLYYYNHGIFLVGKTALKVIYQPNSEIVENYHRVEKIVIDNDGIDVLISPCKNNTKMVINQSIQGKSTSLMLFYNEKMDKDEAVMIKINIDKLDIISVYCSKKHKSLFCKIDKYDVSKKNFTTFFKYN